MTTNRLKLIFNKVTFIVVFYRRDLLVNNRDLLYYRLIFSIGDKD